MRRLNDEVIIVAGGATGIGAETSRRLAEEGARVVVGDINVAGAEETVAGIRDAGGEATAWTFDIADEESCAALVRAALDAYGDIAGLFNVAADLSAETLGRDTDLLSVPLEVWRRTLDVNLTGYLLTMRHTLPTLLERGGGSIVNTISGLVLNGDPNRPSYGAAKSAVIGLTRHVASRWGKEGIRCNAVAPGVVLTDSQLKAVSDEERERVSAILRSNRFGRPEDIAAMATFLLSADGEWVNGQVYAVNGGAGLR